MKPAIRAAIAREVRRHPRPLTAADVYAVPRHCASEEEYAAYFHDDLPGRDDLDLLGELREVELAHRLTPARDLNREWLRERWQRIAAELRRRRRPA